MIFSIVIFHSVALADEPGLQLRLDHAVASSEHVVTGRYEGGRLDVAKELRGSLGAKAVAVERGDVEVGEEELAPKTPRMKGRGVFFLSERAAQRGDRRRRFVGWEGPQGVAWEASATYVAYREGDDGKLALVALAEKPVFEERLEAALARQRALDAAVALVGTEARAAALAKIVEGAEEGPKELVLELGPDPFAQRALVELGRLDQPALLDSLRKSAELAWVKAAAVRSIAATPAGTKRLQAIALAKDSSEEEVVAAVNMLLAPGAESLETLGKLSLDARPRVRRAVALALREKVKDLALLERLMKDEDASVREAALDSARAAARRLGLPQPGSRSR